MVKTGWLLKPPRPNVAWGLFKDEKVLPSPVCDVLCDGHDANDVFCDRHDAKGYHFFAKGANGISQGLYDQK